MTVWLIVALLSCWTQDWLVQSIYCQMADIYCCVIFAASAFISEMSSRLIRNTKRRPAICRNRYRMLMFLTQHDSNFSKMLPFDLWEAWLEASTHLHHWVVVEFPLVAWQDRSAINVDWSSALIGNEEVSIILQFYNSCRQKWKKCCYF